MYSDFSNRSPSQPIQISGASSDRYQHGDDSDSSSMSSIHDQMDGNIDNGYSHLTSTFNNLTVGSLPDSRRGKRYMVRDGGHMGTSGEQHLGGIQKGALFIRRNEKYTSDMSRSLPVPRAPFLHSRTDRDSGERLSRIPAMALPESVVENSLSSSVPYGSLNESQFRRPRQGSIDAHGSFNRLGISSSYNPSIQLDIQKRVQDMKKQGTLIKNGKGGLASLLDNSEVQNSDSKPEPLDLNGNAIQHGGIGSIIQDHMDSKSGEHDLEGNLKRIQDEHGISQTLEQAQNSLHHHHDTIYQPDFNEHNHDDTEEALSTSLTGLSILKSSKGTLLDLNENDRESMVQFSKSFNAQNGEYLPSSNQLVDVNPAVLHLHDDYNISLLDSSFEERQDIQQQPSSDQQDDDGMFNMDME